MAVTHQGKQKQLLDEKSQKVLQDLLYQHQQQK
jgi:hypothetical protein